MSEAFGQLGRTRQRVLRHLLRSPAGASVEQLGGATGVTHNAVRQHLTALIGSGYVARGDAVPTGGRPEQLFTLTEAGREVFPRRYAQLASQLIESVGEELGGERLGAMLARLGARMGSDLAAELPASAGTPARIEAIAKAMTEMGYEARARVSDPRAAPQIVAHNCVFHQLAGRHPQVCGFDIGFLEQASGRPVDHVECMVRGGGACRFRFRKPDR